MELKRGAMSRRFLLANCELVGPGNGPRGDSQAASLTEIAGIKEKVAARLRGVSGRLNAFNLRN